MADIHMRGLASKSTDHVAMPIDVDSISLACSAEAEDPVLVVIDDEVSTTVNESHEVLQAAIPESNRPDLKLGPL